MNVHKFESTGAAYDACQTDEAVKNGDILVIESEGVVGVAYTWPFAVTWRTGELHKVGTGPEADAIRTEFAKSIAAARKIAHQMAVEEPIDEAQFREDNPPGLNEETGVHLTPASTPSSYTAQIDEDQRVMILNALRLLRKQDADNRTMSTEQYDELVTLIDMIDNLPDVERENPGIVHGLCL